MTRTFSLVSDPRQTLYYWRSANPGLTEGLTKIMATPLPGKTETSGTTEHFLHFNYRSVEQLVHFSNLFAENFKTRTHEPSIPVRSIGKGVLNIREYPNSDSEFYHIAKDIHEQVRKGRKYSDFSILTYTNRALNDIESALLAERIPYHLKYDARSTTKQSTFRVAAAHYALVLNPRDLVAYSEILESIRGIGDKFIGKLNECLRGSFGNDMTADIFNTSIRQFSTLPIGQVKVVEAHREKILEQFVKKARQNLWSVPDLSHELRSLYARYGAFEGDSSIREFQWQFTETALQKVTRTLDQIYCSLNEDPEYKDLSEIDKMAEIHSIFTIGTDDDPDDDEKETKSEVMLSTIHGMKGREAAIVYVANLCGLAIPKADPNEEAVCCFYVAVTRAKDQLNLSSSAYAKNYKGVLTQTRPNIHLSKYLAAAAAYKKRAEA